MCCYEHAHAHVSFVDKDDLEIYLQARFQDDGIEIECIDSSNFELRSKYEL